MKRNPLLTIATLSLALLAGCAPGPAAPRVEVPAGHTGSLLDASSSSAVPISAAGRPWEHSVFLLDSGAQRELMPLKRSCGGSSLRWTDNADVPNDLGTVMLEPGGVDLRADGGFARMPDATFTNDCSAVLVIGTDAKDEVLDIWSYDVKRKLWTPVTQDLSPRWKNLENDKPSPYFVYPIDRRSVLVAAQIPTTGGDAYSNLSSLGILVPSTGAVQWFHPGGGLNPVVYDFERRVLSFFDYAGTDGQGPFTLTRTDVTLPQQKNTAATLLRSGVEQDMIDGLYGGAFYCILANYAGETAEYERCMDEFWVRAFPDAR